MSRDDLVARCDGDRDTVYLEARNALLVLERMFGAAAGSESQELVPEGRDEAYGFLCGLESLVQSARERLEALQTDAVAGRQGGAR